MGLPFRSAGLNLHPFMARSRSWSAAAQRLLRVIRTSPTVPFESRCASTIGTTAGTFFGQRFRTRVASGKPLTIQTGSVTTGVRVGAGAMSIPRATAASWT